MRSNQRWLSWVSNHYDEEDTIHFEDDDSSLEDPLQYSKSDPPDYDFAQPNFASLHESPYISIAAIFRGYCSNQFIFGAFIDRDWGISLLRKRTSSVEYFFTVLGRAASKSISPTLVFGSCNHSVDKISSIGLLVKRASPYMKIIVRSN